MNVESFFSTIYDGMDFLMALGSLIGLFGLLIGGLILFFGGRPFKTKAVKLLLLSIFLVSVCGITTGVKYFRVGI